MDRRKFIKGTVVGAMGIASATNTGLFAAEPISRHSGHKFKYSLAAYSYRQLLGGDLKSLSLHEFIDDCASMGLEGTELTSYYFPKEVTPEYLNSLKQHAFKLGVDVSGTAVGNDFGYAEDDPKRKEQIDHVKTWVKHAQILNAPVIRIFAGHQKPGVDEAKTHNLMGSAIEECCDFAGKHGVDLALENHGGPTSTAEGLMQFVNDVQSPWFGVNLDTGNFSSDDVYAEMEQVAPYAVNVQVKVAVRGPDKVKKPSDFNRLRNILQNAGYRGYVVLEYEEGGEPREESRRWMSELREVMGG